MIKRKEKISLQTTVTLNEFLNSCSLTLNSNQTQTLAQVIDITGPESCEYLRACSHEPGTVNYPEVMIAPGQALPRIHKIICCPGATLRAGSVSSDHYEFI